MKSIMLMCASLLLVGIATGQERTLIRGVNVISMVDETRPLATNMDVLIETGRFKSIVPSGAATPPTDATIVDGSGLFMIPGLADAHVHFNFEEPDSSSESQYARENNDVLRKLFVAHGVTFVRSMWGSPRIIELRARCNSGELIGPTICTTGPLLTGNSTPPARALGSKEDVDEILQEHKKQGYDALKIHSSPDPAALRLLFVRAAADGIPVYGHMPFTTDPQEILLQPGLTTVEHLSTIIGACVKDDSTALNSGWPSMIRMFAEQDAAKHKKWAAMAVQSGKWFCPTLMAYRTDAYTTEEYNQLLQKLSGKYVTRATIDYWRNAVGYEKHIYERSRIDLPSLYQAPCDLLAAFIVARVPIIAGTDTPARPGVAGKLLHRELFEYVRLGMTPFQALQTATTNVAQAVDQGFEFGKIAEGYRADAVFLRANPLEKIENLAEIESVVVRGQLLNQVALGGLLQEIVDEVRQ